MEQLFKTDNPLIMKYINNSWKHSTQVAGVCSVLASHFSSVPSDQAMLSGLLHEIGVLSILSYAEKNSYILLAPETLNQLIENHSAKLSQEIMSVWGFPQELIKIPQSLHDFYANKNEADLADLLLVAKIDVLKNNPDHLLSKLNKEELPCYNRLNLDPKKPLYQYHTLVNDLAAAKDLFK